MVLWLWRKHPQTSCMSEIAESPPPKKDYFRSHTHVLQWLLMSLRGNPTRTTFKLNFLAVKWRIIRWKTLFLTQRMTFLLVYWVNGSQQKDTLEQPTTNYFHLPASLPSASFPCERPSHEDSKAKSSSCGLPSHQPSPTQWCLSHCHQFPLKKGKAICTETSCTIAHFHTLFFLYCSHSHLPFHFHAPLYSQTKISLISLLSLPLVFCTLFQLCFQPQPLLWKYPPLGHQKQHPSHPFISSSSVSQQHLT